MEGKKDPTRYKIEETISFEDTVIRRRCVADVAWRSSKGEGPGKWAWLRQIGFPETF